MKFIMRDPTKKFEISAYREQCDKAHKLALAQQKSELIELLFQMKLDFPDRLADTYYYLIRAFDELKQPFDKIKQMIEADQKGIIYRTDKAHYGIGLENVPEFKKLQKKWDASKAELAENSESQLELLMPTNGFCGELLLILHGDGGSNVSIEEIWPPQPYLAKGVAVAYLQSPNQFGPLHYFWTSDFVKGRTTVREAIDFLVSNYGVSEKNITLSGYSGGSMTALSSVTHGEVTVKQCIAFLPCSDEYVGNKPAQSTQIFVFKGELEPPIDVVMAELNHLASTKLVKLKGLSHDLPANIDSYILPHLNNDLA
ncbi:MAG: hypothetical protein COB24_03115 [Hyphomicrobiales bacterium]|nr:MAG: hypothetical protein COB24_03115 [Hyphomicrobiales bacterium]